jgi:uncharacterized protein YndB with AHSA1/START domain
MTHATDAAQITIRRVFDAPREQVWRAWTEPEQLSRWWGARGWSAPLSEIAMDVRPGGEFRVLGVRDADGAQMPTVGTYREVVEPERLVFAEAVDEGCPESEGAVGTVVLTDLGDGRTEMVFSSTLRTTAENVRNARRGLGEAFDDLALALV